MKKKPIHKKSDLDAVEYVIEQINNYCTWGMCEEGDEYTYDKAIDCSLKILTLLQEHEKDQDDEPAILLTYRIVEIMMLMMTYKGLNALDCENWNEYFTKHFKQHKVSEADFNKNLYIAEFCYKNLIYSRPEIEKFIQAYSKQMKNSSKS